MNRIKRSWALTKASFEVLMKDKELMIFPIISALAHAGGECCVLCADTADQFSGFDI